MDAYDGLPTHVCRQCVNQVNVSYNFKRQCEISDATFRELLRNHRSGSQSSEVADSNSQLYHFSCFSSCVSLRTYYLNSMQQVNFLLLKQGADN